MPRVGRRYGLSSKEFTPAMVAGVYAELARSTRGTGSPSASTTTSPAPVSITTRRWTSNPPTACARSSSASVGRDRRRQQEHHQDPRVRRGEPLRSGLFRLRLEEVRLADRSHLRFGPRPIRAPYWSPAEFRRLPRVPVWSRPTCWAGPRRRDPAGELPASTDRVWDALPGPSNSRSWTRTSASTPSTPGGSRATSAWPAGSTSSCRPVSSRSPGTAPDEAIAKIKAAIAKSYGKRGPRSSRRTCRG